MFSFCQLLLIIWYKASLQVSNVLVKNDQIHPKKASRNKYFRIHLNYHSISDRPDILAKITQEKKRETVCLSSNCDTEMFCS